MTYFLVRHCFYHGGRPSLNHCNIEVNVHIYRWGGGVVKSLRHLWKTMHFLCAGFSARFIMVLSSCFRCNNRKNRTANPQEGAILGREEKKHH